MTLKFLSDASVTAGGFQIKYVAVDPVSKSSQGKTQVLLLLEIKTFQLEDLVTYKKKKKG